jgi:hypothetical protein
VILNLALWAGGLVLLGTGIAMIRGPLARYQQLQQTDENLRRYESWRGGSRRTAVDYGGTTGADVMKAQMRQRVLLWAGAIIVGIVLIVVGFVVR